MSEIYITAEDGEITKIEREVDLIEGPVVMFIDGVKIGEADSFRVRVPIYQRDTIPFAEDFPP